MKIVIAIDSFKGSLGSYEAGAAAREGLLRAIPEAEVAVYPVADGGEGTVRALSRELVTARVHDPLGRVIDAEYGLVNFDGRTHAVIEMAAASGLPLLSESERDPMKTSSFGVGELISDAISRGVRDFIIGIGGSATNDGGVGMLSALGWKFLDSDGNSAAPGARGLERLAKILPSENRELSECKFRVACDVTNPLCGELGCSAVFSPQKGAKPSDIPRMDAWLASYAKLTRELCPSSDADFPGSGAAGGLGFALRSYLGAELESGVSLILGAVGLEAAISGADLVVTGEGRLDGQTAMGKAPAGVASLAKKHGKACVALAGSVKPEARALLELGVTAYFPILREPLPLDELMRADVASRNLADTAEQVVRLIGTRVS